MAESVRQSNPSGTSGVPSSVAHGLEFNRIESIALALAIVKARIATLDNCPAAWQFLQHVTDYLEDQQTNAFNAAFREVSRHVE